MNPTHKSPYTLTHRATLLTMQNRNNSHLVFSSAMKPYIGEIAAYPDAATIDRHGLILAAAATKDLHALASYFKAGADSSLTGPDGKNVVRVAVDKNQVDSVVYLRHYLGEEEFRQLVNQKDFNGKTAAGAVYTAPSTPRPRGAPDMYTALAPCWSNPVPPYNKLYKWSTNRGYHISFRFAGLDRPAGSPLPEFTPFGGRNAPMCPPPVAAGNSRNWAEISITAEHYWRSQGIESNSHALPAPNDWKNWITDAPTLASASIDRALDLRRTPRPAPNPTGIM